MERNKKKLLIAVSIVVLGGMALYGYLSYKKSSPKDAGIDVEQERIVLTEEGYQNYLEEVKNSDLKDSIVLTPQELDSVFEEVKEEGSSQEQEKAVLTKEEWERAMQVLGQ